MLESLFIYMSRLFLLHADIRSLGSGDGSYVSQLSLAPSILTNATNIPTREEKLGKEETQDLLISFIYIVKNLAEGLFAITYLSYHPLFSIPMYSWLELYSCFKI